MKIIKKRIINVENYITAIRFGERFHVVSLDLDTKINRIRQIGFSENLELGEKILPAILGPVSRYNSEGKFNIRRDLEKETFYMCRHWEWTDWGGNTHSDFVYIPRERYPRELIPPPSEELLVTNYNDTKMIVSREFVKEENDFNSIKHIINLFLELFGECDLIRENYQPFIPDNITRLNWKIFPQGQYPWEQVRDIVQERVERQPRGNRPVIERQIKSITNYVPSFVAVGQGGFSDYVVFGFPEKHLFILESTRAGNATYVFDNNWERLSQFTKAEILDNDLQQERIIHTPNWETRINQILR